jgi:hypothetical protein
VIMIAADPEGKGRFFHEEGSDKAFRPIELDSGALVVSPETADFTQKFLGEAKPEAPLPKGAGEILQCVLTENLDVTRVEIFAHRIGVAAHTRD